MLKKFINILSVIFFTSLIAFTVTRVIPGDPRIAYLNTFNLPLNDENLNYISQKMGLNIPIWKQYFIWITNILTLNLGNSYITGVDVYSYLKTSFFYTAELMGVTILMVISFSFPLGIISAFTQDKKLRKIIKVMSLVGISFPKFWLGFILMELFGVKLKILPISGAYSNFSILLPSITLSIAYIGYYTEFICENIQLVLDSEFVKYAKLRCVSKKRIIFNYVLLNSLPQIITSFGKTIGSLLGGVAIVENIFAWPGLGRVIVEAIDGRDYPMIQGYIFLVALIFIITTTIVDTICYFLTPKLRGKIWTK